MKNYIRFSDLSTTEIEKVFKIADELQRPIHNYLEAKTILLFFPDSSIRTRVTFEKGIHQLGGQSILFPSNALDKKEDLLDVIGYLNNWADCVIVRHHDIALIDEIAKSSSVPVINAMSAVTHPCEIISDLYSLSKIRKDYCNDHYLFVGANGNIGLTWKEASKHLGFPLSQSCPIGYEIEGIPVEYNIEKAICDKDIILTDSLGTDQLINFANYQITSRLMNKANCNAILNPCPPFYRGEEVSSEVMESEFYVGYEFKKTLLQVQQALILHCMGIL